MTTTDGNWLQKQLDLAAAEKRALFLPTEKPIEVSHTLVNDWVPLDMKPGRLGPATLKWVGDGPGPMMQLIRSRPGQQWPQGLALRNVCFDGGGRASALLSTWGFNVGSRLKHCLFRNCVGPVVKVLNCWDSTIDDLFFKRCRGTLLELRTHGSGVVNRIETRWCEGDTPAIIINGTVGTVTNICLDSGTHYPGVPLLLLDGCKSKGVVGVRTEGGAVKGVEGYSVVELRDCERCGVERVRGVFNPDRPGHCVVRVMGGEDNYLLGIYGGRGATLAEDGCIVESTKGSVHISAMSIFNHFEPGHPKHRPDRVELPGPTGRRAGTQYAAGPLPRSRG